MEHPKERIHEPLLWGSRLSDMDPALVVKPAFNVKRISKALLQEIKVEACHMGRSWW